MDVDIIDLGFILLWEYFADEIWLKMEQIGINSLSLNVWAVSC